MYDDPRVLLLRPLFSPDSVSAALVKLGTLGEDGIRSAHETALPGEIPCSLTSDARVGRSALCVSLLVAIRHRIAKANRNQLKAWCSHSATRASVELQLKHAEFKTVEQVQRELEGEGGETLIVELPCLMLLCAFAITYLTGIPMQQRNEVFRRAILVAQSDGDLIVRDDTTLEEVVEFGLNVADVPRSRWLPSGGCDLIAVKIVALLWSLTPTNRIESANMNNSNNALGVVKYRSNPLDGCLISVMADPHLLLWSAWSGIAAPDAIILESSEEARSVLDDAGDEGCTSKPIADVPATGVVILLVQDCRNWSEESIIAVCKQCRWRGYPTCVWFDSHSCGDMHRAVVSSSKWWPTAPIPLQWIGDALLLLDDNDKNRLANPQRQQHSIDAFCRSWIEQSVAAHSSIIHSEQHRRNVASACRACMAALDSAATGICSDELARSLCSWKSPKEGGGNNNSNASPFCSCWMGLLAHVVARIPDVVPSYSQTSAAGITSQSERRLASLRAAAPPLPPGISMSPDALLVFRVGEQLPLDFFAAFWVALAQQQQQQQQQGQTGGEAQRSWRADATLAKMSPRWNVLYSSTNNSNATSSGSSSSTNSGESMSKAFSFVLGSWWDESLTDNVPTELEEAVGRLNAVADVIDRHRTVEVRAASHSVAASRWELQQIVDSALQLRFATVEQQLAAATAAGGNTTNNANADSVIGEAASSAEARLVLAERWRRNGSFAKRNAHAAMVVAQQVGKVFEREAAAVVDKLLAGQAASTTEVVIQPIVVLRMRPAMERVSNYYSTACATAVRALGAKGKALLWVSEELQRNVELIRSAL